MTSKCFFHLGTACDWNQVHKASSNRNWRAFMIFSHISEPMQEDTTSVIKCRAACGRVDWHWNGKPELSPENHRKSLEHGSLQQFRHWHVWTFCPKQIWNATSATYQRAKCIWTQKNLHRNMHFKLSVTENRRLAERKPTEKPCSWMQ